MSAAGVHAIVLVGGRGTRLKPLTDARPKPMLPIVDRPFLAHQLAHLHRFGITDVTFACGFLPQGIVAHFGDGSQLGMNLRYVVEPTPLGTGGAIAFAAHSIDPQRVIACNGDILTDLDLDALVAAHEERSAVATLALTPVDDPTRYGLVRVDESSAVTAFLEKPDPTEIDTNLVNAGTYVLEPEVVASIAHDEPCSVERDVFPELVGRGLYAFVGDCYWNDIGTPASYLRANIDVLDGRIGRYDHPSGGDSSFVASTAVVDPGASVGPSAVVGERAALEDGCIVRRAVVLEDAQVAAGAVVEECIIGQGVTVPVGAELPRDEIYAPTTTGA